MKNVSGLQWGIAILGVALVAAMASAAAAQTVEEVIAKNIKAQGGREALLGVKALERKGKVDVDGSFGQMAGTTEEISIPWKKAYRALDLEVFVQKDAFNGKTAWRDGMMGIQELEDEEAQQIKASVDLNPFIMLKDRGTKAEKLDDETVDEVAYYVVQLTPMKGPAVKIYIDKESDQIKRTSLTANNPQFGEITIVAEQSDYQEFGPIKLPTKNKISIGDLFQIATTFTETKVNGQVDEAIFEMPKTDAPAADKPKEEKKEEKKEESK